MSWTSSEDAGLFRILCANHRPPFARAVIGTVSPGARHGLTPAATNASAVRGDRQRVDDRGAEPFLQLILCEPRTSLRRREPFDLCLWSCPRPWDGSLRAIAGGRVRLAEYLIHHEVPRVAHADDEE